MPAPVAIRSEVRAQERREASACRPTTRAEQTPSAQAAIPSSSMMHGPTHGFSRRHMTRLPLIQKRQMPMS